MLVSASTWDEALKNLCLRKTLAVDTETTGLHPYHGDRLFSIIFADAEREYYFNFNVGGFARSRIKELQQVFDGAKNWAFVNAKFDLAMLANERILVPGNIIDAGVLARLEFNLHPERYFSLDYLANYYLDRKKDQRVAEHIEKYGLHKKDYFGEKAPDYAAVPLGLMAEYGCSDARVTYDLVEKIKNRIKRRELGEPRRPEYVKRTMEQLVFQEIDLTKVLHKMQWIGIKVDRKFAKEGFRVCNGRFNDMLAKVRRELGESFNPNSPAQVGRYVESCGHKLPRTKTGKPQATKDTLADVDIPIIKEMLAGKGELKKANTYFKNIYLLSDEHDAVHCNLNQDVPITGRLSSSKPNLQNLKKEDDEDAEKDTDPKVRGAFIPQLGRELLFFDYIRQEMHIMVDVAGEMPVLERMRAGEDFYRAVAAQILEAAGLKVTRKEAKDIALSLSYGLGIKNLAKKLRVQLAVAKQLRHGFFAGLPKLQLLDENLKASVRLTGKVYNVYGRILNVPPHKEYKGLNAFVQSTAADNMKAALVAVDIILQEFESDLVLTVHDELIVDAVPAEIDRIIPLIRMAMIYAYPHRHLPLSVYVERSTTRWSEKHA